MSDERFEVQIEEAGGLIWLAPRSLGGLTPEEFADVWMGKGKESPRELMERGAFMPATLYQDDGYLVRVVMGDLNAQEEAEWTARARCKLSVPCGQLLLSGVLTPDFATLEFPEMKPARSITSHWLGCYVEVPPGDYVAEIYAYPPGDLSSGWGYIADPDLFGAVEGVEPEEPHAYFKRTRPAEQPPAWIEDKDDGTAFINFVVRLSPFRGDAPPLRLEEGEIGVEWEFRKPEKCPLGLRSEMPAPEEPAASSVVPIEVFSLVGAYALGPVVGGPVEVPVERLERLVRLACFAFPYAVPEIRVELPPGATFAPDGHPVQNVLLETSEGRLRVRFGSVNRLFGWLGLATEVGPRLGALPDGSVLELATAATHAIEGERPMALHRYRGTVSGGVWWITEAFPAVDAELLRRALALSAEVEAGERITARDPEEAAAILEHVRRDPGYEIWFGDNPVRRDGLQIHLQAHDPRLLLVVGAAAFALRFSDTWPVLDLSDDEEEDEDDQAPSSQSLTIPAGT